MPENVEVGEERGQRESPWISIWEAVYISYDSHVPFVQYLFFHTWGGDLKDGLESSRSQQGLIQVLGQVCRANSQYLGSDIREVYSGQ